MLRHPFAVAPIDRGGFPIPLGLLLSILLIGACGGSSGGMPRADAAASRGGRGTGADGGDTGGAVGTGGADVGGAGTGGAGAGGAGTGGAGTGGAGRGGAGAGGAGTGGRGGAGAGGAATGGAGTGGRGGSGAGGAGTGGAGAGGRGGAATGGAGGGAAGSSGGGGADAGADGPAPDAALVCAPGAVMRCTCPAGQSAMRTCLPDGSAFGLCDCPGRCGDGVVQTGEECDDGNTVSTDGCVMCKAARCGDGFTWSGHETCDDGNAVDGDACLGSCQAARCGDGVVWTGHEACDDGNGIPADGCENNCTRTPTVCGNGIREPGEACDDGNLDNTDACTERCQPPACGDGFVQPGNGEDCDDANSRSGDGCNTDCLTSGKTLWTRTYAGVAGGADDAYGAAVDKDGNLVVVGSTTVSGLGTEILIWKLSPAGDELRTRTVTGTGNNPDAAHRVAINSLNQMAIVGTSYSEATPNPGSKLWYGLYATTTNEIWSTRADELGDGWGVAADAGDNLYFTGSTYPASGGSSVWIRRINGLDAAVGWTSTFNYGPNSSCQAPSETVSSVALIPGGATAIVVGHHLCGGSEGALWRFATATGTFQPNPDGCTSFYPLTDGLPSVVADGIAIAPAGDVYVAGNSRNGGTLWGYPASLCGRTDRSCFSPYCSVPSWTSSPQVGALHDVARDPGGDLVAVGGSTVLRTDAKGTKLWSQSAANVTISSVAIDAAGYIYVVGSATTASSSDAWVSKLTP